MYGDFSRNPFSQKYRITRVLFNQGQPLIEADLNEALYSVIENQRFVKDKVDTGTSEVKVPGRVESPIGGLDIPCAIELPGKGSILTVAQHPFSLAYLSQRLSDKRLIHAVEMWGLRLELGEGGSNGPPTPVVGTFTRRGPIPDDWLIRVEVHSVVGNAVTFKIDTHNAGYANECVVAGNQLDLSGRPCFVRPIRSEEYVEVQTPNGDFILPSGNDKNLARIKDVSEGARQYALEPYASATTENQRESVESLIGKTEVSRQCRFWKWSTNCKELEKDNWNDLFSFNVSTTGLQPGMFWLIDASELNQVKEKGSICVASQHPQRIYFASVTSSTTVVSPAADSAPASAAPAATPEPASSAVPEVTADPNPPVAHLRDLPCGRLASGTSTPVIRRWLASMTLGELEGLDFEQVRSRLVRDCNLRLDDLPNIDDEIGRLVALRDQVFGSSRSALA